MSEMSEVKSGTKAQWMFVNRGRALEALLTSVCMVGLLLLVLAPAVTRSQAGSGPQHSDRSKRQAEEFQQLDLKRRARAITDRLRSSDPEIVKRAQAEHARLLRDFEKWAQKFGVKLIQHSVLQAPAGGGPASGGKKGKKGGVVPTEASCEGQLEAGPLICFLKRARVDIYGRLYCDYECAPRVQEVQSPVVQ
jgi:hypothetical protein